MPGVTPQVVKFEQLRTFKFSIPKLQRNYVWDDDDIDGVIQAINELDNEEGKFLGSLIHWESEENKFDIIDGQQRTATFTMFAKAAVDAYSIWSELNQNAALQNQVDNFEIELFGNMGSLNWHFSNLFVYWCRRIQNTPRGFVTMKGKDGIRYAYIMAQRRSVGDLHEKKYQFVNKPAGQGPPKIYKAYQKMFKYFSKGKTPTNNNNRLIWFDPDGEEWVCCQNSEDVIRILSSCLKFVHNAFNKAYFVQLKVIDRRDIYDIFDAVNGTGVKLTQYDLLRNQLAGRIDNCPNLNDQQKIQLENALADIVDVNDYKHTICQSVMDVVPYAMTGNTKKDEKTEFWDNFADEFSSEDKIRSGIEQLGDWFQILFNLQTQPENFVNANPELGRKLQYFSSTNSKFHLAPLFRAYVEHGSYDDLLPIQLVCEALFINYIIVDREYPQEVKNMITRSLNGEIPIEWEVDTPDSIALQMWISLVPEREDLSESLAEHNEFSNGQSKFLLWNLNDKLYHVEHERLQNLPVPQELERVDYDKDWTLEHILPQKATAAGWGANYVAGSELHQENLNKIGNHSLYKKYQNIKLGNKAWAFKRQHLPYPEGVWPGMRLNIGIFDGLAQWTLDEISARSEELATGIEEIWFG